MTLFYRAASPAVLVDVGCLGQTQARAIDTGQVRVVVGAVGLGTLMRVIGGQFADGQYRVALFWLVMLYLIHSIGELFVSPVGLSMIHQAVDFRRGGLDDGRLVPVIVARQYSGGLIAQFASVETVGGEASTLRCRSRLN